MYLPSGEKMDREVCISIVSHGHCDLIKQLGVAEKLARRFSVIVKVNTEDPELVNYLSEQKIEYIEQFKGLGFGANNNVVFEHYVRINKGKYPKLFIALNPDVLIEESEIIELVSNMKEYKIKLSSITLYNDETMSRYDHSVRKFPSLTEFVTSFLGRSNSTVIDIGSLSEPTEVDWAAGSFLAFDGEHYAFLKGFDEGYFMYCEDIDICYRSFLGGQKLVYLPAVKAIHFAARTNRRIFTKHFRWHLKSVFRYLMRKNGILKKVNSRVC